NHGRRERRARRGVHGESTVGRERAIYYRHGDHDALHRTGVTHTVSDAAIQQSAERFSGLSLGQAPLHPLAWFRLVFRLAIADTQHTTLHTSQRHRTR